EDAGLAVDERDRRLARTGVDESVVEGHRPRLGPQLRDVEPPLALGAHDQGQFGLVASDAQYSGRFAHLVVPPGPRSSVPVGAEASPGRVGSPTVSRWRWLNAA